MWTLLAYGSAAISIQTIVVLGLFRLAELKRAEDLRAPPQVDDWAASHELQKPR